MSPVVEAFALLGQIEQEEKGSGDGGRARGWEHAAFVEEERQMPAFGRFSEGTVEEMRGLAARRDWPGFQRFATQVAQHAEELGVHAYGPGDRAWIALFLDREIRGERMEFTEARLLLGQYDRFLGGTCLTDPAKYLGRFLGHQRSLTRPPFVMVKRCDESPFPDDATLIDL